MISAWPGGVANKQFSSLKQKKEPALVLFLLHNSMLLKEYTSEIMRKSIVN